MKEASKRDKEIVDNFATELGMIEEQRNEFGRRIEEENNYRGRGGSDKYGYDRLKDIGEEIMGEY